MHLLSLLQHFFILVMNVFTSVQKLLHTSSRHCLCSCQQQGFHIAESGKHGKTFKGSAGVVGTAQHNKILSP